MKPVENELKAKLAGNRRCFGTWIHSGSPIVAELLGAIGLDFVLIDQEHGPGDLQDLVAMMQAVAISGTTPMVRVASSDPIHLKRVVDAGAQALLVPMVETADEARSIVDACLYPPYGKRGNANTVVRASRYGLVENYLENAHQQMLIIPQVETVAGVDNAAEMAAVPGVDAVFIGPSDLSGSIGLPGQTNAPEVVALIDKAFAAIAKAGKPVATVPRKDRSWQQLFEDGFNLVVAGSDIAHVREAAVAQRNEWAKWQSTQKAR